MRLLLQMHLSLNSTKATDYILERHSLSAVVMVLEKTLLDLVRGPFGPKSQIKQTNIVILSKATIGMICNCFCKRMYHKILLKLQSIS